jgi:hypothetical protein
MEPTSLFDEPLAGVTVSKVDLARRVAPTIGNADGAAPLIEVVDDLAACIARANGVIVPAPANGAC